MIVATDVLAVLSSAVINENALKLTEQLDRKLYEKTNKVLLAAGGKWNRKVQAHLFAGDASEVIEQIILSGEITDKRAELGFFPTPRQIVKRLLELAEITPEMSVLEPSAGHGAIAEAIAVDTGASLTCYEIDPKNHAVLVSKRLADADEEPVDFLTVAPTHIYDRVVMNPPFGKRADVAHVLHAFRFLKPGGLLVAVMSAGVEFRTDRIATGFPDWCQDFHCRWERP